MTTDPSRSDVYFDIETDGLIEVQVKKAKGIPYGLPECTKLWCISLAVGDGPVQTFTPDRLSQALDILCSANRVIGHNILAFDLRFLHRISGDPRLLDIPVLDTIVVSRMLFPEVQNTPIGAHSLKAWGRFLGEFKADWLDIYKQRCFTGTPAEWKEYTKGNPFAGPPEGHEFDPWHAIMLEYCEQDVVVTRAIHKALAHSKQAAMRLTATAVALEMETGKILADQVETGFAFDVAGAEQLEMKWEIRNAEILDELQRVFPPLPVYTPKGNRSKNDEVFNPGSNLQIAKRLMERYGWEPTDFTPSGAVQLTEATLRALPYPEAQLICEFKDLTKQLGMLRDWIQRASLSRDGRIHGQVNQVGAGTSRMTHSEPNVTQVTKRAEVRGLWRAPEGRVLIGADLSGLELRMLAHYMAEWDGGAYADVVLNGDIHTHNQEMAGLETRDQAKGFIYALLYGAGDAKLGVQMGGVSAYKAKKARDTVLQKLPALAQLIDSRQAMAETHGHVQLLDGRWVPADTRRALNRTMQGSGSVIAKQWLINIRNNTRHLGVQFHANVHDEIQMSCPPDHVDEVCRLVTEASLQAGEQFDCRIPIASEAKAGASWWETH